MEVNPENPDDVILGGNCNYASPWPDPAYYTFPDAGVSAALSSLQYQRAASSL